MCTVDDLNSNVPAELKQLTLADMLVMMSGFAVFFMLSSAISVGGFGVYVVRLPLWYVAMLLILWLALGLVTAVSFVILLRIGRFRRLPRSGEWLVLMILAWFVSSLVPPMDTLINYLWHLTGTSGDFGLWRWTLGGLAFVGSGVILICSNRISAAPVARVIGLFLAVLLFMWGPCVVLHLQFADLFPTLDASAPDLKVWFLVSVLQFIGHIPMLTIFMIPVAATVQARRRDHFQALLWTEWTGMTVAAVFGALLLFFGALTGSGWNGADRIAEVVVGVVGLAGLYIATWSLLTIDARLHFGKAGSLENPAACENGGRRH